ncbi:MAG: DUF3320 domain-containing protein, partial [Sphingomonadales bacterium]
EYTSVKPHQLSSARLAELVTEIVVKEQPIHQEEVGRRLANTFRLQRSGSRIQAAALEGLKYAARQGLLNSKGKYWRSAPGTTVTPRDRSNLPSTSSLRKIEMICPTELAAAMKEVLKQSLALDTQELITESARALGFARTGGDISAAMKKALQTELRDAIRADHLGRIQLIE